MITSIIYKTGIATYNLLPGKALVCNILKASGIPNGKFYKDVRFKGIFRTQPEGGTMVKIVNHGGNHENEIFWKGLTGKTCYEADTLWLWQLLSKEAKVIIDVGANIGVYSLAAKALNPAAKVIAFEPAERTIKYLKENIVVNNFEIDAENIALSNSQGQAIFYDTVPDHQTSASLNPDKVKNNKGYHVEMLEYKVEVNTLDNYLKDKGIAKVDLIKIDVEMHEPEVLKGMKNCIASGLPSLFVEVLNNDLGKQVEGLLKDYGYMCFSLTEYKQMKQVTGIDVIPEKWNYFFCQPKVAEKLKSYIV
jgi:FkbM family methyltransferase